jgi:cyclophilin family peptidyl-prolyl cis-trans isomerase
MKKLLFPIALVFATGCGAQQAAKTADSTSATTTGANTAPADSTAAPVAEEGCPAPAKVPAQKPGKYRVVDEVQPGMPPAMVSALRAVKLPPPPESFKVPANARVQLQTSKGNITVELDTKGAPLHSKSFYYLSTKGFFNGTTFHRWANLLEGSGKPGYIIQGGDPLSKDPATRKYAGSGGPGYQIPREHNASVHNALVLAAARTSDPNSAGSQFYLTQNPVCFLDEGDGYTVFGRVVVGKDAALKLTQDDVLKKAVAQ